MKQVIKDNELKKVMLEAVDLICDAVGSSLGPSGNNVLINMDDLSPFITNDGVTIAKAIESEDKIVNSILEIIKEASLKTDETVGDGTTTTLVLLQAIYKEGLKEIEKGQDGVIIKKQLELELDKIINELHKLKRIPTEKDLISIGTISSNDKNISIVLNEVYNKMKNKNSIRIEESNTEKTYYEIKKGYSIDIDLSPIYFKEKKEVLLENTYILLIRGYLSDLELISSIINEGITSDKNIIIFATEVDETVKHETLAYNLKNNTNIYIFELPDYGLASESIFDDLSSISDCNIKNIDYEKIYFDDLGVIEKCILNKEEIIFISNKVVSRQIEKLKTELDVTFEDYERELINERISKLENGIATIYVGGLTKTEKKERKMRFIDALSSIDIAKNGIVIGEGIAFYKISELIDNNIMKNALKVPFKKILKNSGIDYKNIETEIKNNRVYNFKTNELEDINNTTIIDPINVLIESIKNATSIAAILLTTNYLVVNEKIKNSIEL